MSLFVLIYDRARRELLEVREFGDEELSQAHEFRSNAVRHSVRDHLDQEIVLFQAGSLDALKSSHGSYFYSAGQLQDRTVEELDRDIAEAM